MIFVLGDFTAKSNNWYKNDTTSNADTIIDAVTSNYRLHQLIQELTLALNSFFSIEDLIFTSTKFNHGISSPFIFTFKLLSLGSLCKT